MLALAERSYHRDLIPGIAEMRRHGARRVRRDTVVRPFGVMADVRALIARAVGSRDADERILVPCPSQDRGFFMHFPRSPAGKPSLDGENSPTNADENPRLIRCIGE